MGFLGGKTQRFHSLYVPVANKIDYCRYTVRRGINWISLITAALFIYSAVGLVLDALSLVSGSAWSIVSYFVSLLLSGIIKVLDLAAHYEDRFTGEVTEPGYYENIAPPDKNWEKLELHMAGGKTEPVFRCCAIDALLRGDKPLDIERDMKYEKRLDESIHSEKNWGGRLQQVPAPQPPQGHVRRQAVLQRGQVRPVQRAGSRPSGEGGARPQDLLL